jgi:flavin-dependent dehydrogenase
LKAVHRGRVALIGDASGSVDAITGDGLCMSFQQAIALADALEHGDLAQYQTAHRQISQRPDRMSALMLALDRWPRLRSRVFRVMSAKPELFERMVAMHVGALAPFESAATSVALGWQMLRG